MTREEKWLLEEKYAGVASPGYEADKERLAGGEPLAYVIGSIPFFDLKIFLDSHPLIPRTETEWWTERMLIATTEGKLPPSLSAALRAAKPSPTTESEGGSFPDHVSAQNVSLKGVSQTVSEDGTRVARTALDLCAGSGAIGCAMLAHLSDAHVFFGEIDQQYESTILKNIRENKLDASRASIRIGDLFEPFVGMRFDLIATNPPYIPSGRLLPPSVIGYEPKKALYGGEDGLTFIRRIAEKLSDHLTPTGTAWIECDRNHAQAAQALFEEQGLKARLCSDQYGAPRFVVVSFT